MSLQKKMWGGSMTKVNLELFGQKVETESLEYKCNYLNITGGIKKVHTVKDRGLYKFVDVMIVEDHIKQNEVRDILIALGMEVEDCK